MDQERRQFTNQTASVLPYTGGAIVLCYLWYRLVSAPGEFHLIMAVNLVFHEAGHLFLMPFGDLLHALGGTIFEIGIPLLCLVVFLRQQSYGGALFTTWWLATALFSVGTYMSDARTQQLPLITGDPSSHDWTTLFSRLGLLPYDTAIGSTVLFLSYLALSYGGYLCYCGILQRSRRSNPPE